MAAKDMTSSQMKQTNSQKILKYLQENSGEISNEELSRETGVDKTNIPRELKKLESKGYEISKRYEQKGRSKFVWFLLTSSQEKETNSQTATLKKKDSQPPKLKPKVEQKKKTPSILENREYINSKFIEEMGKEHILFDTTIPIDKKQEIVSWVFKNIQNLYDGVYNYRRIWKKRYERYLVKIPDSPVIGKYELMGVVLEFIKEIQILKEKLENATNRA